MILVFKTKNFPKHLNFTLIAYKPLTRFFVEKERKFWNCYARGIGYIKTVKRMGDLKWLLV